VQIEGGVEGMQKRAQLDGAMVLVRPQMAGKPGLEFEGEQAIEIGAVGGVAAAFDQRLRVTDNEDQGPITQGELTGAGSLQEPIDADLAASLIAVD
jgi:hypothetical protein